MNRLLRKIRAKSRSLLFTALIAIGCVQLIVPPIFDMLFYAVAIGLAWLWSKIGRSA